MMGVQTITREKLVPTTETIYVTQDGKEFKDKYTADCHQRHLDRAKDMAVILERLFPGRVPAVTAALADMGYWSRRHEVLKEIDKRINAHPPAQAAGMHADG